MKENKNSRRPRPMYFYYAIVFAVLLLAQWILGPMIQESRINEVPYSTFVKMVDEKKVTKVKREDNQFLFEAKDDKGQSAGYRTGPWKDESLTKRLEAQGVEFSADIPQTINPIFSFLLTFILPFALLSFLGYRLMKNMGGIGGIGGGGAMSFGKSNAKIYVKAKSGKSFQDVAGQEEAIESLKEIVNFLDKPKRYSEIGAICPKGVLLVGPPGTGKTLLAQAVAGEAEVPFFSISGSEFVELFVGMGASKVRDLFSEAKKKAPCIVFIDEIDAIGKRRDTAGFSSNDEREQTLNQLLSEMDGFEGNSGVVILAATNRPEILDKALTRPGRFDRLVRVELPDIRGREDILKVHSKDVKMEADVNLATIAKMTAGTSGAELANIINEGALRAVRMNRSRVTEEDLVESVETVIAGQQKKNAVITDRDKKMIAYHEVGHALVAALQKFTAPVTKITIIPRTSGALGYTMQVDEEEKVLMTREDLFKEIVTLTGGRSAEELIFGTKTTGASNDIERATKLARSMVTRFGMTEEFDFIALETSQSRYLGGDTELMASPGTATEIDRRVRQIISQAHELALSILKDHRQQLEDIAGYLLEKETITGDEFMDILNRSLEFYGQETIEERKQEKEEEERSEDRRETPSSAEEKGKAPSSEETEEGAIPMPPVPESREKKSENSQKE